MADWNPALYRRFESERTRPAIELLARVPLAEAPYAVDLGCGPGNSTELLAARYPQAQIDVLVRNGNESLFTGHPFVHQVLVLYR